MARLVDSAHVEGCWLFTPENNHWYNIGFETYSKTYEDGSGSTGVHTAVFDLLQLGHTVSHYHIHLKSTEMKEFDDMMSYFNGLPETERSDLEEKIRKYFNQSFEDYERKRDAINRSIPSSTDMNSYVMRAGENPDCQMDFKIVSPYGLLTLTFRENAEIVQAEEKYVQIWEKIKGKIALESRNESEAISLMVERINKELGGLFTMEMDFRE